ncbi:hypothetical protein TBLA_0H03530 [Henningerozyma blattae CBS 6284]|uniref:Glycosyltransferase family 15 protein n=1 Tax=Henningerozyma blattae (strain ATCC 34711 / CBS 6284 / DSM 70876 / NBRC 10599 / NRRL Y-10934 / UCD 77-7) TaxID=1071380 RepID=I2H8D2_HENB6|nr:hypothetical protein TBLA_0H03530 [Tetrapisispora blattae CBS 6284]CCH62634.1 hypothetical protein TBLA_0H03530 [Tetrapisispora blattae CBS 6284]
MVKESMRVNLYAKPDVEQGLPTEYEDEKKSKKFLPKSRNFSTLALRKLRDIKLKLEDIYDDLTPMQRLIISGICLFIFCIYYTWGGSHYDPVIRTALGTRGYKIPVTDIQQHITHPKDDGANEKGVFITLCRNEDLFELTETIRNIEEKFNNRYHYDWVFFNDNAFTKEFVEVTSALASGKTRYAKLSQEYWGLPDWIDEGVMKRGFEKLTAVNALYADSVPYRHMCRFQAGLVYNHPLLKEYKYFWRVDHDVKVHCKVQYDLFKFLRVNKKKYGFILSLHEYPETIPTLWQSTKEFMEKHPEHVSKNNLMKFISDDEGKTYNLCHFWSNFEVGSLDFFRSKQYQDYFKYLDSKGGFYYERWGDAPIHSIAASVLLDKSEVHFFEGMGYSHLPFTSCPAEAAIRLQNECTCDPHEDDTWEPSFFCNTKFFNVQNMLPPVVNYNY